LFRPQTVFVVGAGGSHELGLPVGADLAQAISDLTHMEFHFGRLIKGDHRFFDVFRLHFQNNDELNRHLKACRQIHEGILLAESIDNYIDRIKNDAISFSGKLAIAYLILKAERESKLGNPEPNKAPSITSLQNCWHLGFLKILCDGVSIDRLGEIFNDIIIIDFNYDRCIPQFLRYAISRAYHIEIREVEKLLDHLTIIRPYGDVGSLNPQNASSAVGFGTEVSGDRLLTISTGLKTFTEQIDDSILQASLTDAIGHASQIIFLGFAYHKQNLELLGNAPEECAVLGTALGFSPSDTSAIEHQIRSYLFTAANPGAIALLNNLTCAELIRDYRRTIAA
jgi:hypothetical protein